MAENVMNDEMTDEITDEIAVADTTADVDTDGTVDVQEKKNKSKKLTVLITYLITVACLLAGLLVPLFNWGFGALSERMLIRYLPSMVNNVLAPFAKKELIPSSIPWFLNVYTGKFDLASLACVLYALLTVVSLFMIIPVCLGKKHKKTSVNCALAVEILAVIITAVFIAYSCYSVLLATGMIENLLAGYKWAHYNMLIPFGGALIAAIIQSVLYKGNIGVSKTISAVLSVLAVVTMLNVAAFVPALYKPLINLNEKVSFLSLAFVSGIFLPAGMGFDGLYVLYHIKNAASTVFGSGAATGTVYVLVIALAVLTVLNIVCDLIGLSTGKKFKKNGDPCRNFGSNVFTLVRYAMTFVFALILVLLAVFLKGYAPGLFLLAFTVIAFFQLINALVRLLVANSRVKKATAANAESLEFLDTPVYDESGETQPAEEPAYAQPVYEQPAYEQPVYEQPVYAQPEPAETQPVYEQPVYEQTTFEQPTYEQAIYEDPVYQQPTYDQPAFDRSAYDRSNYDRSNYDRSAYERPSYDRSSLYRQPAYEQPTFEDLTDEEPEIEEPEVKAEPKQEAKKPVEQPAPAPAPAPVPETIYVYSGDTDEFIDTLTDKEKVEFVEVFIKKSKGTVNGVPDYRIKGDNSDFFPAVFVHINRYRDKLSDALMGKMYKQLGK